MLLRMMTSSIFFRQTLHGLGQSRLVFPLRGVSKHFVEFPWRWPRDRTNTAQEEESEAFSRWDRQSQEVLRDLDAA